MVIKGIDFIKGDTMSELDAEDHETPTVTEGHPDEGVPNELADDAEVDALVQGVSTELEAFDGTE